MKNVLIIAHNNKSVLFWQKYLPKSEYQINLYRADDVNLIQNIRGLYELTIVDLYFNKGFLNENVVEAYAKTIIPLRNLGRRFMIGSAIPECKILEIKIQNFNQEFIDNITSYAINSRIA